MVSLAELKGCRTMKWDYQRPLKDWPLYNVEERLQKYKAQLKSELRDHGLSVDFHLWVSDEWFCPDGVPGFALPFYLFNPDLMKIHRMETGRVEGRTDREILKLMRHELGHAIDNAYGLRKDKERQDVFGPSSRDYPEHYAPRAYSKSFIRYLGDHYAQSHPDEDFAETFAYWLDPEKMWHLKSFSKNLQKKLHCMNRMMRKIRNQQPKLTNQFVVEPIAKNSETLGEYYARFKRERALICYKRIDRNLTRAFSFSSGQASTVTLAQFLKSRKKQMARDVAKTEGVYKYEAELALKKIIERAEGLGIEGAEEEFQSKAPTLVRQNFRYLKEKDQLRFYL